MNADSQVEKLFLPLRFLKGVGPKRAELLSAAGLHTVYDLLHWIPRTHYDRRRMRRIADARPGDVETLQGVVLSMGVQRTRRRGMTLFHLRLGDESGAIDAVWFRQAYLEKVFRIGDEVIVSGRVDTFHEGLQIKPDEFEIVGGEGYEPIHAAGLVPAYPPVEGFGRKALRRLIHDAVAGYAPLVPDALDPELRQKRGLMPAGAALKAMHFPHSEEEKEEARRRLAYDEFYVCELTLAMRRRGIRHARAGRKLVIGDALDARIRARFPFLLTRAQERVIGELRGDLTADRPMNRLLQGDVGSGKTVVAAYALLAAVGNDMQAAIMAPTEILAEQHARTFGGMLQGSRVRIRALTGGARQSRRGREIRDAVAAGEVDLVIGTHALLEEDIRFKHLAVVVIDEQQKFGVLQRAALRLKGERPHVLVMTATPIPRTLAMTLYGDLDLSVLDEMPPGRKPVTTLFRPESQRGEVMAFVRKLLREGRQAYFVSPLVEASETLDLESATRLHEKLAAELAPHPVSMLHGRMTSAEKEAVMNRFRTGDARALVSTLVIEVGIDVPNATVLVIENSERFGLSQLHQLRGRIGRGAQEGYCILFGDPASEPARERIKAFTETADGFKIAEVDLKLRGPGDFFGTRQSGLPEFRVANLIGDAALLAWAREDAFARVEEDPQLRLGSGPLLRAMLGRRSRARAPLATVG
ncbi:MAG: ATP-dependent DNA helicase RecG [Planctomycetes bacterium]|nr:ATP-dependent DNA helicase RecG [Planctomycetota bacterium]